MVFIVSDQRIATENFEKGKIYKVVFLDESIFYGVCLGIGSNFVMLSGNISGYLFPLTMETASQVESIDLFDPTPPEPPVPWTNLLQYQTGEPPFTFNTTDDQLFSWYITGAGVGDKTANLFDKDTIINGVIDNEGNIVALTSSYRTSDYISVSNENCTIKLTMNVDTARRIFVALYDNNKAFTSRLQSSEITGTGTKTYTFSTSSAKYIRICIINSDTDVMLVEGSTAPENYQPYGYKIPISCNENITNIYLDAPLEEGEILYSTDVDTAIITDIGDNTLSVLTEAQPSEMQIVYKIADR